MFFGVLALKVIHRALREKSKVYSYPQFNNSLYLQYVFFSSSNKIIGSFLLKLSTFN